MQIKNKKAFTMIELVFIIVVIGILAAVALPRFGDSADSAYIAKAQATLATVRAALATERQRRILRGDAATGITSLGFKSDGTGLGSNAFDHFSGDGQTPSVFTEVLQYPIKNCGSGQIGCWLRSGTDYTYMFPDSADGDAKFELKNNRLDCKSDAADCLIITQ